VATVIPWSLVKRGVRLETITPLDTPQAARFHCGDNYNYNSYVALQVL